MKPGQKVKIIRGPYKGKEGVVIPRPNKGNGRVIYVKPYQGFHESVPCLPEWLETR